MRRFRAWRESLKSKSAADEDRHDGPTRPDNSHTEADARTSANAAHATGSTASTIGRTSRSSSNASRSRAGSAQPQSAHTADAAATSSPLSFAATSRARIARHALFVSLLSDPDTFASFLRFLPASQQHELLFICEINQLIEKSEEWDEAEIFTQAIKIANIFLRNADASSATLSPAPAPPGHDIDESVLQVQSIQPATRRQLQACIPLTLPAHLQGGAASVAASSSSLSLPTTDSSVILTMLEMARDQVEESISQTSLPKFIDLSQTAPADGSSGVVGRLSMSSPADAVQLAAAAAAAAKESARRFEYTFEDCQAAVAHMIEENDEDGLGYVFRSFLLFLMEDRRHSILCSWAEVQRAIAASTRTDAVTEPATTTTNANGSANGHPSSQTDPSASSDPTASSTHPSPPPQTLAQLYSLYTDLEDAYRMFYPDTPLQPLNFSVHAALAAAEAESESSCSTPATASARASAANSVTSSPALTARNITQSVTSALDHLSLDSLPQSDSSACESSAEAVAAARVALLDGVRDLTAQLRPISDKMEKLLRYTFWPQFCKSEYFHKLTKIQRPTATTTSTTMPAARSIPADPRETPVGSTPRTNLTASGRRRRRHRLAQRPYPSTAAAAAAASRVRHGLVSSLKQQKVTREMLVLECASWAEADARATQSLRPPIARRDSSARRDDMRERVLEYVCVLRSTSVLPPRTKYPRSGPTPTNGPPLPPRPPKLRGPRSPHAKSPEPDANDESSSPLPVTPGIVRGHHSLSHFYRYPAVDHAATQLPAHLIDLAFPLMPSGEQTSDACTCAQPNYTVQCLLDTIHTESVAVGDRSSSTPLESTGAPGATLPPAAPSPTSASVGLTSTPKLFNLVCTQEDGSLLHGCVLQLTQVETIEERWDEFDDGEEYTSAASAASVAGVGSASASPIPARMMVGGIGAAADTRLRRSGSSGSDDAKRSISDVGSSVHARQASIPMSSRLASAQLLPSATDSAPLPPLALSTSPPDPPSKLSQMIDGFARDVKNLVERATGDTNGDDASRPQTDAPSQAAAESTAEPATDAIAPDTTNASLSEPVPQPTSVPSTSAMQPLTTSSLASFYAPGGPAAAGLEPIAAAATDSSSLPPTGLLPSPVRARRAPVIHRRHRIFRVQTQYAIVVLTRHPLFDFLRQSLARLIATDSAVVATSVSEAEREQLRRTQPLALLRGVIGGIFDSNHFYRLLLSTRIPARPIDLFGLSPFFASPAYLRVPTIDFRFELLFQCMHPRRVVRAFEALVCERRIIMVSASNTRLTLVGQALVAMLYPFTWRYLYVPLLPVALFKYLACPTPFLMGVHACHRRRAIEVAEGDIVIVDIDNDRVTWAEHSHERKMSRERSGTHDEHEKQHQDTRDGDDDGPVDTRLPSSVRDQFLSQLMRFFPPAGEPKGDSATEHDCDGQTGASSPTALTPDQPAIDPDAHRIVDPYAASEAPPMPPTPTQDSTAATETSGRSNGASAAPLVPHHDQPRVLDLPLQDEFSSSSSLSTVRRSSGSSRALLFQLECVKLWSHLLKQYRRFVIRLPAAGSVCILLFDSPAFVATKPDHYQPFISTIVNTSYLPAFLHERTYPCGLDTVKRDAFDRYEASLSGARVQVWHAAAVSAAAAYADPRQTNLPSAETTIVGGDAAPPAYSSHARRLSLTHWLDRFRSAGLDPSLHQLRYLAGWNTDDNLTWEQVERQMAEQTNEGTNGRDEQRNHTVSNESVPADVLHPTDDPRTDATAPSRDAAKRDSPPTSADGVTATDVSATHLVESGSTMTAFVPVSVVGSTPPSKSSLYRTRRPSNAARDLHSRSREHSPRARTVTSTDDREKHTDETETVTAATTDMDDRIDGGVAADPQADAATDELPESREPAESAAQMIGAPPALTIDGTGDLEDTESII